MTGINPWNNHILDFPDFRYSKYRSTAEKFRIIQVGICTWKKTGGSEENNSKNPSYIARPYNIYIFPEDFSGNNLINCETAALIFNREHKMDFNKWIYKGIPYLNAKQESNLIETLSDGNLNFYNPLDKSRYKNVALTKNEDKVKYEEFCKLFSDFLYSDEKTYFFEKYPKFFMYYILNNTPENIRKRLYFSYETLEGKPVLMISKLDEEEKKLKLDIEMAEKMKEINRKKGVRKIWEAIVKKKGIFVGHNCNLDLLFTISHLGDPLPPTLKEFKELMKSYFTSVYDTKLIFENFCEHLKTHPELKIEFKNSHLETVYTTLRSHLGEKIKISIHGDMKNTYAEDSGVYHEAAFDAYVTGCSFIYMGETLKENLTPHSNKLYLMKSIYNCFNINGDETYAVPDSMAYCLKAIKQTSDIDLKTLLEDKFFERVKKCYNIDVHNSLLILVNLETAEYVIFEFFY
jgi:hypothetical protein